MQLVISDLGWLNINLCNLQNTNSQIFPTKTPHGNPITDYQQKKKERKKFQNFFASIYQEFQLDFLKLRNLQNIN